MRDPYSRYFEQATEEFLARCNHCGRCVRACPVVPLTKIKDTKPAGIQKAVRQYLSGDGMNDIAYERAFSCMECYRCTSDICPNGLDMLAINELVRSRYQVENDQSTQPAPGDTHPNRVLASIQTTPEEYKRIFTPSPVQPTQTVFFPGCNVYAQPQKLLTALDILEKIDSRIAFLPGLEGCCGSDLLYEGYIEGGGRKAGQLIKKLSAYQPKQLVLWCPTCHVRFEKYLSTVMDLPFEVLSLPQYLENHLQKHLLKNTVQVRVTLHEACKAVYTGVDPNAVSNVLKSLPGVNLLEMPRHGRNTTCCGGGAPEAFVDVLQNIRESRLEEASRTGAEILVDVCHYCHHTFAPHTHRYGLGHANYITLIARCLGIEREDPYNRYRQLGDTDQILVKVAGPIAASPYSRQEIAEALHKVFGP